MPHMEILTAIAPELSTEQFVNSSSMPGQDGVITDGAKNFSAYMQQEMSSKEKCCIPGNTTQETPAENGLALADIIIINDSSVSAVPDLTALIDKNANGLQEDGKLPGQSEIDQEHVISDNSGTELEALLDSVINVSSVPGEGKGRPGLFGLSAKDGQIIPNDHPVLRADNGLSVRIVLPFAMNHIQAQSENNSAANDQASLTEGDVPGTEADGTSGPTIADEILKGTDGMDVTSLMKQQSLTLTVQENHNGAEEAGIMVMAGTSDEVTAEGDPAKDRMHAVHERGNKEARLDPKMISDDITGKDEREQALTDIIQENDGAVRKESFKRMADIFSDVKGKNIPPHDQTSADQEAGCVAKELNGKAVFDSSTGIRGSDAQKLNQLDPVYTKGTETVDTRMNLAGHTGNVSAPGEAAEGAAHPNSIRHGHFTQLMDNISYVIKSNNRLGVSVEHDAYGKIDISVSMEKGVMNVNIHTSASVVREYIESNVHHIVDSLAKDGVNVGGVSVALRERNDHEKGTTAQNEGSARERTVVNAENVACAVQGLVNIFA